MNLLTSVPISKKLPAIMVILTLVSIAVVSLISVKMIENSLMKMSDEKFEALGESRKKSLSDYLVSIQQDLAVVATNEMTKNALEDFKAGWALLEGNQTEKLQDLYIETNPHPTGEKDKLYDANDGSVYSAYHAKYHPWFHQLLLEREYYDIFLFDTEGNLVYTVYKELDYATNLNSGEWADTDLGNAFRVALESDAGVQSFFDFKPYAPSHGAAASFISTPIVGENGRNVGVLVFQMPIGKIDSIMQENAGLGEEGETYLIGDDYLMRSNSHFSDGGRILETRVENEVIVKTLETDRHEKGEVEGYRGYQTFIETFPMDFMGTEWVLVVEEGLDGVMAPVKAAQKDLSIASLICLLIIAVISIFVARTISAPLAKMQGVMVKLSDGDYATEVPYQDRGDEIGKMAHTVQVFKENGLQVEKMQAEQEEMRKRAEIEKKEVMQKMASDFDARVGSIVNNLKEAAENMMTTANAMQQASDHTSQSSTIVASAAEQADANVQSVAAATEELTASSSEIARQIDSVAKRSSQASGEAQATSASVNELNELADSIGEVVGAIKDIAEQTNLLALNATIEAARAGEAGKGFAVVADEVKKLANETANKTEEIDDRVNRIQTAIRNSVTAMEKIIEGVTTIDEATASVATAIEEQNAATSEISKSVIEATTGTKQVSSTIVNVQQLAADSGQSAQSVLEASQALKGQTEQMASAVHDFLDEIRGS